VGGGRKKDHCCPGMPSPSHPYLPEWGEGEKRDTVGGGREVAKFPLMSVEVQGEGSSYASRGKRRKGRMILSSPLLSNRGTRYGRSGSI